MKTPSVLLSFDIEEFDLPTEYGAAIGDDALYSVAGDGTRAILDLLREAGDDVKATFFTTGRFAERFPKLVKEMAAAGHEVASHGYSHSSFAEDDLAKSKRILEDVAGAPVVGFRMARLAPVDKRRILDAGYRYESSMNPIWLPGRYNNLSKPILPFREECGLWQFPISVVPGVRFPLFWLSFKNLPLPLYRGLARFVLRRTGLFNMYSHPWEYDARAREPQWRIPGYVVRHAGEVQAKRLASLIASLRALAPFRTFSDCLAED